MTPLAAPEPKTIETVVYRPVRRKLPDERQSLTHKFSIGGHEGYITVGMYEDGTPGEVFIAMAKEGSTISGLMDTLATSISYGLQYGVPLKFFVDSPRAGSLRPTPARTTCRMRSSGPPRGRVRRREAAGQGARILPSAPRPPGVSPCPKANTCADTSCGSSDAPGRGLEQACIRGRHFLR